MNTICRYCGMPIPPESVYCPSCGKLQTEIPFEISNSRILWLIFISIFLPPLGLIPGIKYMLKDDSKATMVGLMTIILTFLSLAVAFYFMLGAINTISSQYSQLNNLQNGIAPQ